MFIGKYGEIDDFGEYAKIKKTNENKTFHKSFKVFLVFTLMLVLLSVSSSVSAHDINQDDSILNCADTCDVAYADVCGGGYVDVCDVACADDLDDSVLSQDDSVLSQDVSVLSQDVSVLSYDDSVLSKDDFNQAVLSSEDENTIYLDYENGLDSNNGNSSSPVKTLEKAYELVPNGGMISLAEGTVFKNSLNDIVIMKNISIKGVFNKSIINANQNRVFFIPNNYSLSLDSVVIENAYTDENGGAICNEGTLIVNNSVFRNNTSKVHGGAIDSIGIINVSNSFFIENTAGKDAGAISSLGTGNMFNTTFYGNNATRDGGAIKNRGGESFTGLLNILNCSFLSNNAMSHNDSYGGAVYAWIGHTYINNSTFFNNSASIYGGAVFSSPSIDGEYCLMMIKGSTFIDNRAKNGVIYVSSTHLIVNECIFLNSDDNDNETYFISSAGTTNQVDIENNWWGNNKTDTEFNSSWIIGCSIPDSYLIFNISGDKFIPYNNSSSICIDLSHNQKGEKVDLSNFFLSIPVNIETENGTSINEVYLNNGVAEVLFISESSGTASISGEIYGIKNSLDLIVQGLSIDTIFISSDFSKYYGNASKLTGQLIDSNGYAVIGAKVIIIFNDKKNYTRITDENGQFSLNLNANPGNYRFDLIYEGDDYYIASNKTVLATVLQVPTRVIAEPLVKYYRNSSAFVAKLVDNQGNPIANKKLSLLLCGKTYVKTTNEAGEAILNINLKEGSYPVVVKYAGDVCYKPSYNLTGMVVVIKPSINPASTSVKRGNYFSAVFKDYDGNLIVNSTVSFKVSNKVYYRTTDENGIAKLCINLKSGNYQITSAFESETYGKTTLTSTIKVSG